MLNYLLTLLIFTPAVAAIIIALLPKKWEQFSRYIALGASGIQLLLGAILWINFDENVRGTYGVSQFQFVEYTQWIDLNLASLGKLSSHYFVGIDGLNITLIILSVVVLIIGVISSWNVKTRIRGYFSLYLILNGAILGCFLALDFLLFYLFFEFMLLPMYFLIGLWGGLRREYASIKFFLYTLLGSVFILLIMIALYSSVIDPALTAVEMGLAKTEATVTSAHIGEVQERLATGAIRPEAVVHTFNMLYMTDTANYIPESILDTKVVQYIFGYQARWIAFLVLFFGFAIKIPVVPFHTWLPDAHVEASTPISVILAALLLKVGGYGLMRSGYLILPDGAIHYAWWVALLGIISIIYGGMNALASNDLKRLIAYSSVSHMGFVLLGLASMTIEGVSGAVYQMVSHGFISAALFLIAGVLYDRTQNRMIDNYSGLAAVMPKYTVVVVIFFFASLGLPGFSGFIAEIFVLLGAFGSSVVNGLLPKWMAIVATTGLVIGAAYYLWTIQRMFFGKFHTKVEGAVMTDLNKKEMGLFIPLAFIVLLLGIMPAIILDKINYSVLVFVEVVGKYF